VIALSLLASGCEVIGTVGSILPLTLADGSFADREPEAGADAARDAMADVASDVASDVARDAASDDASDASARRDVERQETGAPEVVACGPMGQCPLARECVRGLCAPLWSGCTQREKCNGLDDDCDGVADNDVDCGGGEACAGGLVRCGATCVSLADSPFTCGSCDGLCSSRLPCRNGVCGL
jgi:hypothetical protein